MIKIRAGSFAEPASQPRPRRDLRLSVVLPTFNERDNVVPIATELLTLRRYFEVELLFVDDDSSDGTAEAVRHIAQHHLEVRLIRRVGRSGLSSAIREGILDATGDLVAVMDCDGQHEPAAVLQAVQQLLDSDADLVVGSRFHAQAEIIGLSDSRQQGSSLANRLARFTLPAYRELSDFLSGFFVLRPEAVLAEVRALDVNGFKFLYELLALSHGRFKVREIPLTFQPRSSGESKLEPAIVWDFFVSFLHLILLRIVPRRAISFALVGCSGVLVQLCVSHLLRGVAGLDFSRSLIPAALVAASSNYLINNALTFRFQRLRGRALLKGLVRFQLVASLPVLANVGVASLFYSHISHSTLWAQLAGILVVFVWNYAASSRFVWNSP